MPGYGKRSMYAAPEPTVEISTVQKRFVMPTLSVVQILIIATIAIYAYSARKNKGVVISSLVLTAGILHIYDHLYRVKRGSEQLFFLPKKEAYACQACK